MNYTELKGKIVGKGFSVSQVSKLMGFERTTLTRKLNSETLKISELEKICDIIGIKVQIILK